MQFSEKLWKMWEKIETLNLPEQKKRGNYLVPESKYHTTKFFPEHLLAMETKETTEILMNKPVYLGLPVLELSKILMYEFWYDYVKLKYG